LAHRVRSKDGGLLAEDEVEIFYRCPLAPRALRALPCRSPECRSLEEKTSPTLARVIAEYTSFINEGIRINLMPRSAMPAVRPVPRTRLLTRPSAGLRRAVPRGRRHHRRA
jgi:hypothetical protein